MLVACKSVVKAISLLFNRYSRSSCSACGAEVESYVNYRVLWCQVLPYNGIFSRRQIFAVLSKKYEDYFSRILIFAVGNVREK